MSSRFNHDLPRHVAELEDALQRLPGTDDAAKLYAETVRTLHAIRTGVGAVDAAEHLEVVARDSAEEDPFRRLHRAADTLVQALHDETPR